MSERRGLILLAGIVLLAAWAATAPIYPISQPANSGRPPVTQQQTEPPDQPAKANQQPGSVPTLPLYVKAACDHGCGYAENNEGMWEKIRTDPVAAFTGVLAALTFGLIVVGWAQAGRLR